jgi:hypothetical protein
MEIQLQAINTIRILIAVLYCSLHIMYKGEYLYLIECNKGSLGYPECLGCQGQYQGIIPLTEHIDIC